MRRGVVIAATVLAQADARLWKMNDELRIEFSGPQNTPPDDGIHLSKFEITGISHGTVTQWTKTISMGEGESKSEEVVGCENRCDSDGLLFNLMDECHKEQAQNFLFMRQGSSKRIMLRPKRHQPLGGSVLGALFENPDAFLTVLKYQNIVEHPPAIRPQLAAEPHEDDIQELDLEDSIFAMFEPPDLSEL